MEAPGGAGERPDTQVSCVLDPSAILRKAGIGSGALQAASLLCGGVLAPAMRVER